MAAVIGGLMSLPIFTVVRQSLSVLVPVERRRTAYAADSMGVELSFMTGPAVGVVVATSVSTTAALLVVGATTVLPGLGKTWFDPPTRSEQLTGLVFAFWGLSSILGALVHGSAAAASTRCGCCRPSAS